MNKLKIESLRRTITELNKRLIKAVEDNNFIAANAIEESINEAKERLDKLLKVKDD